MALVRVGIVSIWVSRNTKTNDDQTEIFVTITKECTLKSNRHNMALSISESAADFCYFRHFTRRFSTKTKAQTTTKYLRSKLHFFRYSTFAMCPLNSNPNKLFSDFQFSVSHFRVFYLIHANCITSLRNLTSSNIK